MGKNKNKNKNNSVPKQGIVSLVEQKHAPTMADNFTRTIDVISIDEETLDDLVNRNRNLEIEKQVEEMKEWTCKSLTYLGDWLTRESEENHGWIAIENKDVYYHTGIDALFPNLATFELGCCSCCRAYNPSTFNREFAGYNGELITETQFKSSFVNQQDFLKNTLKFKVPSTFTLRGRTANGQFTMKIDGTNSRWYWDGGYTFASHHVPVYELPKQTTPTGHILQMVKENLIPKGLSKDELDVYVGIKKVINSLRKWETFGNWTTDEETIMKFFPFYSIVWKEILGSPIAMKERKVVTTLTGKFFDFEDMKREYTQTFPITDPKAEVELRKGIDEELLKCDNLRANLDPYQEKLLTDPNGGHWDLWELDPVPPNTLSLKLTTPLVARNPVADIHQDGIIGIDFGTKSTVVVFQENSEHTLPLRVGTGQLSEEIKENHYENPTVLEFVNLAQFLEDYRAKDGRPDTLWEDVTSSHTAFSNFLQSSSSQYYSYLYELKQWAGDSARKIHLRDKQNLDMVLDPYQSLEEGDFDPIEIYAYYLGLYINNMHNGIYLDYLLSYPVAYEKAIRDRIVASFTRGLKKSLPQSILENKEVMSKFRVSLGASEPVAYAICALEECGFEPEGEEEIFYGVFDFGGGTTDFDFGLYRESESRRYDYEVQSFGDSGDQYLGGENLLELLAFEIFKKNQVELRKNKTTFVRPTECKRFAGDEVLISDSQEAKRNMAQLKEKLRPLWERHESYEKEFEAGTLKVQLVNSEGVSVANLSLDVTMDELEDILKARIEKGVKNFFESLVLAFNLPKNTSKVDKIYILKAGNSSKSALLTEVMDKYITEYNQKINGGEGENHFLVFPPLGTDEADAFMEEQGLPVKKRSVEDPTCKTGVAFGLISSRQGGKIKLIREVETDEEVKFPFYLGFEKRQKFKALHKKTMEYGEWAEFIDAEEVDFTIYYSKLPTVLQGHTAIEDVKRKRCRLKDTHPSGNVYVRAASPTTLEYVVATEEGIKQQKYLSEITTETLED